MEQYIQPFIKVCNTVFKKFIGEELQPGRPYFSDTNAVNEWDVSAVIGFSGEARGAVVISLKQDLAIRLTGILTNEKHEEVDSYVVDAVGEIVNIIAGNVKRELDEEFRLMISLPTIIQGKDLTVKWSQFQTRVICIPFTIFGKDIFCLMVAMEATKKI